MDRSVADRIVRLVRARAVADARRNLRGLHAKAVAAGAVTAGELIATEVRGATALRYNNAARTLRDWYITVYTSMLDHAVGQRTQTLPDAATIEATAVTVRARQSRPSDQPRAAFLATVLIHRRARLDAIEAATGIERRLVDAASQLAAHYLSGEPADRVALTRQQILRHWYQRCYLDTLRAELGTQVPLTAVSDAEARAVAATVHTGQARRIIGTDGYPLMTNHSTVLTDRDRRTAAGETLLPVPDWAESSSEPLRTVITRTWAKAGPDARGRWAADARIPESSVDRGWRHLPGAHQSALITSWLRVPAHHRTGGIPEGRIERFTLGPVLTRPPERAAAAMFNHPEPGRPRDLDGIGRARQLSADLASSSAVRATRVDAVLGEARTHLDAGQRPAAAQTRRRPEREHRVDDPDRELRRA